MNRPIVPQSISDRVHRESSSIGPIDETKSDTVIGNNAVATSIARLLCWSSPTHVARFVVSFLVRISVKRMAFRWAWSHIFQKCFEAILPLFTHCDTAPTIVYVITASSLKAPTFRRFPSPIFTSGNWPAVSMPTTMCTGEFSLETAATARRADTKLLAKSNCYSPAFAATTPLRGAGLTIGHSIRNLLQNSPTAERFTSKINERGVFHHAILPGNFGRAYSQGGRC